MLGVSVPVGTTQGPDRLPMAEGACTPAAAVCGAGWEFRVGSHEQKNRGPNYTFLFHWLV